MSYGHYDSILLYKEDGVCLYVRDALPHLSMDFFHTVILVLPNQHLSQVSIPFIINCGNVSFEYFPTESARSLAILTAAFRIQPMGGRLRYF